MLYKAKAKKTQANTLRVAKIQYGGNIDETIGETYFSNVSKEKELNRIFEVNDKFIFIFEGAPGIGKTVVAKQIAYEWANNKILANTELLLLLYFRDPELQNVQNFSELMKYCNASKYQEYFYDRQGKNLMLVFDGYDELSADAYINSLFEKLLCRKLLPCCSIIFTSRPHNTAHLHNYCDCKIEILGFSGDSRFDFLTKNNVSNEDTDKVKRFLQRNLIFNSLCYIPFNMASLLLLVAEKENLPKTQTELTKRSISITISHHIRKSSNRVEIKREDMNKQIKDIINSLAPLAYTMIEKEKLVFTETEINNAAVGQNKNAFGLLQVVQFTNSETLTETLYSFVHFSIQEYLAAYYLSQRFSVTLSFHLRHSFWDEKYFGIWKMYIGITQAREFALQHYLSGENYFIYGIQYFLIRGREFRVSDKITIKKINHLYLYQMFLEAPESRVKESLSSVVTNDTIDLNGEILYLEAVSRLTYCITRSYITMNWKMIKLSGCKIGDEECSQIFQGLSLDDGRQKPVIHNLDLSNNNITFEHFFRENSVHGNPTIIHCLNISGNSIANFKVLDYLVIVHNITDLIICNNVQQIEHLEMLGNNSTIKMLNLSCNNHWPTVQWTLPSLPRLRTLDMSYSYFEDDSIKTLQVHENLFPSLQELLLSHCHLTGDGIAKLLYATPKTVQLLDLSYNQIDDHGVTSLQQFFHHNDGLQQLRLVATSLSSTNIIRCVQTLKGCTKLEILDISENDITDDEAESVVRLCHEIPSLKELKLKDIHITEQVLRYVTIEVMHRPWPCTYALHF